jgi:uncharacterized protein DUF4919
MMQKSKSFGASLALICVALVVSIRAQPEPKPSPEPAKPSFATLLERAKKGDESVDFGELRMAYTETAEYSPYGTDRESRNKMLSAINAGDYNTALELANKMLSRNFLNPIAHFGARTAHRALGHIAEADRHKQFLERLIRSIQKSGDGKTPATAFVVISNDEESFFLTGSLRLSPTALAQITRDGHNYELVTAVDENTNEKRDYYFNIDKLSQWRSLKK